MGRGGGQLTEYMLCFLMGESLRIGGTLILYTGKYNALVAALRYADHAMHAPSKLHP